MVNWIKRQEEGKLKQRAKQLRTEQTDAELILWQKLRANRFCNIKFYRQKVIGNYIVDFVCLSHRLVIELDGSQHLTQQNYDELRTKFLNQQGFNVIRFWNREIYFELDRVLDIIFDNLNKSKPSL